MTIFKLNKNKTLGASILSAISLKLCCWGPLLLTGVAGISGSTVYFSWLDVVKPYLLSIAFISLAFGFYQIYKPNKKDSCNHCNDKEQSVSRSKIYIWFVAIFVVTMTLITYYPQVFYKTFEKSSIAANTEHMQKLRLNIQGLSCVSCEENINHTVNKLPGIINIETSFKKGNSEIEFDPSKTDAEKIRHVIESKGYIIK